MTSVLRGQLNRLRLLKTTGFRRDLGDAYFLNYARRVGRDHRAPSTGSEQPWEMARVHDSVERTKHMIPRCGVQQTMA